MDTTIAAHQWGMGLTGWLAAGTMALAGIALGVLLGRWWGRPPPQPR